MKKRLLSALLAVLLLCSLLSGCCILYDDTINADGTSVTYTSVGFSEAYYKAMYDLAQSIETSDTTFEEFMAKTLDENSVSFQHNGVTYWGTILESKFTDLAGYNNLRFPVEEGAVPTRGLSVDENGNYVLNLTLSLDEVMAYTEDYSFLEDDSLLEDEPQVDVESGVVEETDDAEMNSAVLYTFHLPKPIGRASGDMSCYTLDGGTVVIDLLKMAEAITNKESLTFQFSTAAPTFVDTPVTAWYTAAAEAMAAGGLMAGVGDSRFSPDSDLTVGELAQILARATGLPVGTGESGYWAEIAIKSCLEKGYITDRGEITQANYGVPVDRQESIAAMQRASGRKPTGTLTAADIPDFAAIKDEFKQDLLDAYNSGVTAGMDENRTCGPDLSLTRAQVAQLFYALGWTAPLA